MSQKGLFHTFYPDQWEDSTYGIDFECLYREGYRGLIFDIDNTLVPHGAPADERAVELFRYLHELGFSCCLLSNNQLWRVKPFAEAVQAFFIENAHNRPSGIIWRHAAEWAHPEKLRFLSEISFLQMSTAPDAAACGIFS